MPNNSRSTCSSCLESCPRSSSTNAKSPRGSSPPTAAAAGPSALAARRLRHLAALPIRTYPRRSRLPLVGQGTSQLQRQVTPYVTSTVKIQVSIRSSTDFWLSQLTYVMSLPEARQHPVRMRCKGPLCHSGGTAVRGPHRAWLAASAKATHYTRRPHRRAPTRPAARCRGAGHNAPARCATADQACASGWRGDSRRCGHLCRGAPRSPDWCSPQPPDAGLRARAC
jgi:hypothetical protein